MSRVPAKVRAVAWRSWRALPAAVRRPVYSLRYGAPSDRQWLREVMNRDLLEVFAQLGPERLDAVEVSGDLRQGLPWRSYNLRRWRTYRS